MNEEQGGGDFLSHIKRQLDDSSEQIDELTLARLGAARRRAVEAGSRRRISRLGDVLIAGWGGRLAWLAGGICLLLVAVTLRQLTPPLAPQTVHLLDDMELLGASEDLDFYRELDFYLWVTDEQDKS